MTDKKMTVIKPADELRNSLEIMKPQFKLALSPQLDADKFTRIAQTAIASNPQLLKADRTSLFAAVMKAAQASLLPDGKESALVMFGDKVMFLPMVSGILKQVRNSGSLSTITSQIIHKNDVFEYYIDQDGEHFKHVPNFFGDRGDEIGAYALARTKDGAIYIEVMTEKQLMDVQKTSRAGNSGPWAGPFRSEMKRKSVLRRLAKRLPSSTDLDLTFKYDDENYDLDQPEKPTAKPAKKASRLAGLVKDMPDLSVDTPQGKHQDEPINVEYADVPQQHLDEELPI